MLIGIAQVTPAVQPGGPGSIAIPAGMPANVQQAFETVVASTPSACGNPLTGGYGPGTNPGAYTAAQIQAYVTQGTALFGSNTAALQAELTCLQSSYLPAAQVLDAWNAQQGNPTYYTQYAQNAIAVLQAALGIAPSSSSSSSSGTSSGVPTGALIIGAIALLIAVLVINR